MQNLSNMQKASMIEVQWKDVRSEVAKLNAPLAKIIDAIDPGPEYTFFRAKYPFGAEILRHGPFLIPDQNGRLLFINDPAAPSDIRDKLNYNLNSNPAGMLLKNTAEICMIIESATIPLYGLIYPGKVFGTWQVLNQSGFHTPIFLWNMTAGARSLFMLPKITDTLGYNRLRQVFQLDVEKPKKFLDHWNIFREIANHPAFGETWETEILFFSKTWFEHLEDPAWQPFKLYLLENAWKGSEFFRNEFMWDMIFSMIQYDRGIKPDPYVADTVRHLLSMSIGAQPGFVAAINDEAGPIQKLQKVFDEIYRTDYAPVIMQPSFLSKDNGLPVYYSLEYPTMTKFSPKSREKSSKISELFDTMRLLEKYLRDIRENKYNVSGTPLFEVAKKVEYEFFHPDSAKYPNSIKSNIKIQEEDVVFQKIKNFPVNSSFLAGCVRLGYKGASS